MRGLSAISFQFSAFRQNSSVPKLTADRRLLTAENAFTLIELLVVITIIAILSGLIVGASKYAWTKSATSRAQAEIAAIETALEGYKTDYGIYPTSTSMRVTGPPSYTSEKNNNDILYKALVNQPKRYFAFKPDQLRVVSATVTNIIDPFGNPYNYYRDPPNPLAQSNQVTFDLWSYGPDGKDSTTDDITNWRR
jgi:general secretion pathway protein G